MSVREGSSGKSTQSILSQDFGFRRTFHRGVRLPEGIALFVGGQTQSPVVTATSPVVFRVIEQEYDAEGRRQVSYEWEDLDLLPTIGRQAFGISTADIRTIVTGGYSGSGAPTDAWDIITHSDSQSISRIVSGTMPTNRGGHAQATLGNKVLVCGGFTVSDTAEVATVYEFNIDTEAWTSKPSLKFARTQAEAIQVGGGILVVGGRAPSVSANKDLDTCEFWDGSSWTQVGSMSDARYGFALVKLPDDRVLAIGGVGYNPSRASVPVTTNACEVWDSRTKFWTPLPRMAVPRAYPAAVYVPDLNAVVVTGGKAAPSPAVVVVDLEGAAVPTSTQLYAGTENVNFTTLTGALTVVLEFDAEWTGNPPTSTGSDLVKVYFGGTDVGAPGNPVVTPGTLIGTAPGVNDAGPAHYSATFAGVANPGGGSTPVRVVIQAGAGTGHGLLVANVVVTISGAGGAGGVPEATLEILDLATMTWRRSLAQLSHDRYRVQGVHLVDDLVVFAGGSRLISGSDDTDPLDYLFIPAGETLWKGGLNSMVRVEAVPSSDVFVYKTPGYSRDLTPTGPFAQVAQRFRAEPAPEGVPGPFVFDPKDGISVTGIEAPTASKLLAGHQYLILKLATGIGDLTPAQRFPDQEGWLVFGFGHENQVWPVRYIGRISDTELALDAAFTFPADLAAGTTVHLAGQREPFTPETKVGAFYATASSAGRVAASEALDDTTAAGVPVNRDVVYPGDRGLGGEGLPKKGSYKIADVVRVWGGDDLADQVKSAKEGD